MANRSTQNTHRENKTQLAAFRKAARELGCEPDDKRFQDALRAVAKAKPPAVKEGRSAKRRS